MGMIVGCCCNCAGLRYVLDGDLQVESIHIHSQLCHIRMLRVCYGSTRAYAKVVLQTSLFALLLVRV